MIDRSHPLPITRQARALGLARSTVYALPRPVSDRALDLMKRIDRLHLQMPPACSRQVRRCSHAACSIEPGRHQGRPQARGDADEADGHRGAVPQAENHQEAPGAPRLPVPVTPSRHPSTRPGLCHGHHLHPDDEGLCVPGRRDGRVLAEGFVLARLEHHGPACCRQACTSALRPWRKRLLVTASLRSSTPTKAHSSPHRPLRGFSRSMTSRSAWTAKAPGVTMSLSNACGDP